ALRREFGDLDGALRDIDAALAISQDYEDAHLRRGVLRREMGDVAGALDAFDRAARVNADDLAQRKVIAQDLRPLLARAEMLRDSGRTDDAKAALDAVFALDRQLAFQYPPRGLLELFFLHDGAAAATDFDTAVRGGFSYRQMTYMTDLGLRIWEQQHNLPDGGEQWRPRVGPDVPVLPAMYYYVIWAHLARVAAAPSDDSGL